MCSSRYGNWIYVLFIDKNRKYYGHFHIKFRVYVNPNLNEYFYIYFGNKNYLFATSVLQSNFGNPSGKVFYYEIVNGTKSPIHTFSLYGWTTYEYIYNGKSIVFKINNDIVFNKDIQLSYYKLGVELHSDNPSTIQTNIN